MDKKSALAPDSATAPAAAASAARPVRSAKDAINAMYADNSSTHLSDYLATSAKDIINSKANSKSAANLHSHSTASKSRLRTRPSASGMLRTAKVEKAPVVHDLSQSMDPLAQKSAPIETRRVVEQPAVTQPAPAVIRTSLKLAPKKTAARPQAMQARPRTIKSINGQKGPTTLTKLWAQRRAEARAKMVNTPPEAPSQTAMMPASPTQTSVSSVANKKIPKNTTIDANTAETLRAMQQAVDKTTHKTQPARPRASRPAGLMQDVVRQPRNVDGFSRRTSPPDNIPADHQPTSRPADSVKRRFKPAPKDYTSVPEIQEETYDSYDDPIANRNKPPVEIYGMMEDDYTVKTDGLGVVEDYRPEGDKVSTGFSEQKVAQGSGAASPDNNKYALGGQSPFFLKSVSVEKRPLSEGPRPASNKAQAASEGTLYEHPDSQPVGGKNIYEKKESKKPLPTKPTVIIPAARKSKAPMIFLLILTIILGAAVGAFAYLCFFQYME